MNSMMDSERLSWLDDVPVEIEAAIAGPTMRVSDILALRAGNVIATPRPAGESIDVFAGQSRIGAGELSNTSSRVVIRMIRFGSKD